MLIDECDSAQALSPDELTNVHKTICNGTGRATAANCELRPVDVSLQDLDRFQLCGRIYRLEQEILRKEQESQKRGSNGWGSS